MKKTTMPHHLFVKWKTITEDAIRTLSLVVKGNSGWSRESVHIQVEELKQLVQELEAAELAPEHTEACLGRDQPVLDTVGYVRCLDVSQDGSGDVRYHGLCGLDVTKVCPTFEARATHAEAEADVRTCYRGKKVAYVQHAVVPLVPRGTSWESAARTLEAQGFARMAPMAAAASATMDGRQFIATPTTTFTIGGGNNYQQAWAALLAGHQVRMPHWDVRRSWIFENNVQEILTVQGASLKDWQETGVMVRVIGKHQLFEDWHVLPIVDHEQPTV